MVCRYLCGDDLAMREFPSSGKAQTMLHLGQGSQGQGQMYDVAMLIRLMLSDLAQH